MNINKRSHRFLFKKTKWKKFTKSIESHYNIHVPNKRNLSNLEIDQKIEAITDFINKQIEANVPTLKLQNSVNKYINKKIEKLYQKKSQLLCLLVYV